jgi:peptidoglycan/LPS O-acetylase OafA/YrhL
VEMVAQPRRVGYLDGLRAVAVLLVVVHHAVRASNAPGVLARLFSHGNHGVELFFVLSGFCLSYPTLAKLRRDGFASYDVVRYAAHRVVRIVPPYWLAIVATLLFGFAIARLGYALPSSFGHFSPVDVLKQALFVDQGVPLVSAPFWTLPVEFRWYFLFPVMLWLWTKSPRAFAIVGAIVFFLPLTRAANFDALYFPPFLLGIVAADVHVRRIRLGWWPIAACAAVVAYAIVTPVGWRSPYDLIPIWYLGAFAFVLAAGEIEWLTRILSLRALTAVGLASYSIYLVHDPVVTFACERGVNLMLASGLAVAAGFAFWSIAERPFVSTAVRDRLIAEFEAVFGKWAQRIGIGRELTLGARPAEIGRTIPATRRMPQPSIK